jgi:prolyl-tRNA synthetase
VHREALLCVAGARRRADPPVKLGTDRPAGSPRARPRRHPAAAAPFKVGLINLKTGDAECDRVCDELYRDLNAAGVEVLYDDRNERPGAKFADMDLIGVPWHLTVGPRGLKNGVVELKRRATGEREELPRDAAFAKLTS